MTGYDYFGARYYSSRIGRWGGVEPFLEKFLNVSPYVYSLNRPLRLIDIDGRDVYITGEDVDNVFSHLSSVMFNLQLSLDEHGKLSYQGTPKTTQELLLANAIDNLTVVVNLISTLKNQTDDVNYFIVGAFMGSTVDESGLATVTQYFNVKHAKIWEEAGGGSIGQSVLHEILEGYIAGFLYPGKSDKKTYQSSHAKVVSMEDPKEYYPQKVYGTIKIIETGEQIVNRAFLIDATGNQHQVYTKDDQ